MSITVRDLHFDFSDTPAYWLNNDPYLTHMLNASSPAFPYLEGFVIYTVKQSLSQIKSTHLRESCFLFLQQEANHAAEHVAYNQMLEQQGYQFVHIINNLKNTLQFAKKHCSALTLLALSVGLEALTTMLSKTILEKGILNNNETAPAHFWRWHLQEELEHRSVLFDLYREAGGGYIRRISMLTIILTIYCYFSLRLFCCLLSKDKLSTFIGLKYLFTKNIFFLSGIMKLIQCYRLWYHPHTSCAILTKRQKP